MPFRLIRTISRNYQVIAIHAKSVTPDPTHLTNPPPLLIASRKLRHATASTPPPTLPTALG